MARNAPPGAGRNNRPADDTRPQGDAAQEHDEARMHDHGEAAGQGGSLRSGGHDERPDIYPAGKEPDAATPLPTPTAVVGHEVEGFDADAPARKEAAERGEDVTPPGRRAEGAMRNEMLEDPKARTRQPMVFGLIILGVIVIGLLLWAF